MRPFEDPKVELEQYPTAAHIASRMLMAIESDFGELEGRAVCDLGCGAGVLSIGAAVLGAGSVLAVDVDADALRIAQKNVAEFEGAPIDFLRSDVAKSAKSLAVVPRTPSRQIWRSSSVTPRMWRSIAV